MCLYATGPGESTNSEETLACSWEMKRFAWSLRVLVPNFHVAYECSFESLCRATELGR